MQCTNFYDPLVALPIEAIKLLNQINKKHYEALISNPTFGTPTDLLLGKEEYVTVLQAARLKFCCSIPGNELKVNGMHITRTDADSEITVRWATNLSKHR